MRLRRLCFEIFALRRFLREPIPSNCRSNHLMGRAATHFFALLYIPPCPHFKFGAQAVGHESGLAGSDFPFRCQVAIVLWRFELQSRVMNLK